MKSVTTGVLTAALVPLGEGNATPITVSTIEEGLTWMVEAPKVTDRLVYLFMDDNELKVEWLTGNGVSLGEAKFTNLPFNLAVPVIAAGLELDAA